MHHTCKAVNVHNYGWAGTRRHSHLGATRKALFEPCTTNDASQIEGGNGCSPKRDGIPFRDYQRFRDLRAGKSSPLRNVFTVITNRNSIPFLLSLYVPSKAIQVVKSKSLSKGFPYCSHLAKSGWAIHGTPKNTPASFPSDIYRAASSPWTQHSRILAHSSTEVRTWI